MKTLQAFILGMLEFRSSSGRTYYNDPWHPLSVAYDTGRDWAHRLTLRHFDY